MRSTSYLALYGPEARKNEMARMFGYVPMIIGQGELLDTKLSFADRRFHGEAPTIETAPGENTPCIVYWLEYYEQRRLERRLGYPLGIARGTYYASIEGTEPIKVLAYYVPGTRQRISPGEELIGQMTDLYEQNGWDTEHLGHVVTHSGEGPSIRRIR